MGKFERLLDKGLEHLGNELLKNGTDSGKIEELTGAIDRLNFPALLGFLGTSSDPSGPLDAELIDGASSAVATPASGVSADNVGRLLRGVLRYHGSPSAVRIPGLEDEQLKNVILRKGVEELAKRSGVPITPEQAMKIANLLATGEFFEDIGSATAAILFTIRGLPIALLQSPLAVLRVPMAVPQDLQDTPFSVLAVVHDLMDGKLDDPPVILSHTLKALYSVASIKAIAEMISTLIAKDNETVRLAIIIYARANGIPLEDEDIDVLHDSVFNTADPDLGPVLVQAVDRLEKNSGGDAMKILARLGRAR